MNEMGLQAAVNAQSRIVMADAGSAINLLAGGVIAGEKCEANLYAGELLGKDSNVKWAPTVIGTLPALHDTSGTPTTLTVGEDIANEIVRRIGTSGTFTLIGPPAADGVVVTETVTFSTVNTGTGEVTVTATSADFASGSIVAADDGSETPKVVVPDGYDIKVNDGNGNRKESIGMGKLVIGGYVTADKIPHYSDMDGSVQQWVKDTLNKTGQFIFTDDF